MSPRRGRTGPPLDPDEADRLAHERPNVPPVPFDPDPESWESRCTGNQTQYHGFVSAKLADRWRCGSCGAWLRLPKGRT